MLPHGTGASKVSQVHLGRSALPVSVISYWPGLSAKNIYKATPSSGSRCEIERYKDINVYLDDTSGQFQGPADSQSDISGHEMGEVGGSNSEEVCLITYSKHRAPGVHGQFTSNDNPLPSVQNGED